MHHVLLNVAVVALFYSLSQLSAEEAGKWKQSMPDLPKPVQNATNHQFQVSERALSSVGYSRCCNTDNQCFTTQNIATQIAVCHARMHFPNDAVQDRI